MNPANLTLSRKLSIANPTRPSNRLMGVEAIGAIVDSGSPTKVGLEIFCLPLPPIL